MGSRPRRRLSARGRWFQSAWASGCAANWPTSLGSPEVDVALPQPQISPGSACRILNLYLAIVGSIAWDNKRSASTLVEAAAVWPGAGLNSSGKRFSSRCAPLTAVYPDASSDGSIRSARGVLRRGWFSSRGYLPPTGTSRGGRHVAHSQGRRQQAASATASRHKEHRLCH
jgi:hypothetical protein